MHLSFPKLVISILLTSSLDVAANTHNHSGCCSSKRHSFKPQQVQLLPGIFRDAQNTDLQYILALDPDRLLAPFLRESGLEPVKPAYPNWESTGLDGHIGGHYLTALSLMYAATGEKELLNRLNYMIDQMERCQQAYGDGYIGGVPGSKKLWQEIAEGRHRIGAFDMNGKWVPLYNIHKTYAGLRDAWLYTGNEKAKKMLIRFTDWMVDLTSEFSERQMQNILRSEHGGLNEVFADVAEITGERKYLELAYRFSHHVVLNPLAEAKDQLNGMHANTQIPKVVGFERIAQIANDQQYRNAARFFWETVVHNRSCVIGGNSVREHFHPIDDFSSMISSEEGPETCNTYNMMKLSRFLFETDGAEKYIDYYERAMYNHILSSQHPDGGFVYFTPMRPGHYRVYSQVNTSFWCCVGSGIENHAKYNELIYSHNNHDVWVNLFVASKLNWADKGLKIRQETNFPMSDNATIIIETSPKRDFSLHIRYPSWVTQQGMEIRVNGKKHRFTHSPGSYISISRTWKTGDKIRISLPMQTRIENLPDGSDYVAFVHGPIVLAARTNTENMTGLFADDSRGGHIATGPKIPLNEVPALITNNRKKLAQELIPVKGKPLSFTLSKNITDGKAGNLILEPFFGIHSSRYIIYWQVLSPELKQQIQQKQEDEEKALNKLQEATIDMVFPGQQQPESDHFVQFEDSQIGVHSNRHWRDARGWFSYQMKDPNKLTTKLSVTYYGPDRDRRFRILINNQEIAKVHLDGKAGDRFVTVEYPIDKNIVANSAGILTVKFEAEPGFVAGGVYEVRVMK